MGPRSNETFAAAPEDVKAMGGSRSCLSWYFGAKKPSKTMFFPIKTGGHLGFLGIYVLCRGALFLRSFWHSIGFPWYYTIHGLVLQKYCISYIYLDSCNMTHSLSGLIPLQFVICWGETFDANLLEIAPCKMMLFPPDPAGDSFGNLDGTLLHGNQWIFSGKTRPYVLLFITILPREALCSIKS